MAQPSAIFVIFITSRLWPIIINTAVGIRNIPQDYRNVAAVVAAQSARVLLEDHDPSAAPIIFTGLRIGIGLSWLPFVPAEMLIGGVASASSSGMPGIPPISAKSFLALFTSALSDSSSTA